MQIIRCTADHDREWNRFVAESPRASFYHRAEWRTINQRCFGHETAFLGAVAGDGSIVGVLPLVRLKSTLFGNVACSMPFVNYGGPCGIDDGVEQRLLDEAQTVIERWGADYLELRTKRYLGDAFPSSDHKVSMTIALDPDPEVLWNRFKTGQRNEIRRAYKNGFTARFGREGLDDFYTVLSESWRDLGTPIYRKSFLKAILDAFPDATRLCVVYAEDGTPVAGAFDGIHAGTVEGMWLGMRSEYRKQLVGYVLYWELIKHACEQGYARFHLGRSSKDSGGEQFKKKWNAESLQLFWHYILRNRSDIPSLNVQNPRYQLAIQMWRRLPLGVTQAVGPFIARSIP